MTSRDSSVFTSNARFLCEVAGARGAGRNALLAEVGLSPQLVDDRKARIPYTAAKALWDAAARFCGDEFFGLHAAERLRPEHTGAMGYAVRSSLSGTDAIQRMIRYVHLYYEDVELALVKEGSRSRLTQRFSGGEPGEYGHATDFILAAFVLYGREFTGVEWTPTLVSFQHKAPSRVDEYRRIFRCPVSFGDAENAVAFETRLLGLGLRGSNPELLAVLESHVEAYLARLPRRADFASRVRQAVAEGIHGGSFGLEKTARGLHMSARTVQRRLHAEGTSHREILDGVRQELARRYLREHQISLDQVACYLGFSEPSAFHRAFRRWTGTTPAAFRSAASRAKPAGGALSEPAGRP
jgi:AraC-like DNA-binding protein